MSIQGAINNAIGTVTRTVLAVRATKALEAEKAAKQSLQINKEQRTKVNTQVHQQKDYLDQPTSMGGSLRDLNLNPEQLKQVQQQLKGD